TVHGHHDAIGLPRVELGGAHDRPVGLVANLMVEVPVRLECETVDQQGRRRLDKANSVEPPLLWVSELRADIAGHVPDLSSGQPIWLTRDRTAGIGDLDRRHARSRLMFSFCS